MASDQDPVYIRRADARRIEKALQVVEAFARQTRRETRDQTPWTSCICRAVVTTAITTGSMSSPSSAGRAQIWHKSPTWAASGSPVTVFNDNTLSTSIPTGRVVKIAWIEGEWWLVSASCS